MPVNVEDKLKKLTLAQRKKVESRAEELRAEEMTLRELRTALKMTQVQMASQLGTTQDNVSRLEKRWAAACPSWRSFPAESRLSSRVSLRTPRGQKAR
jgi:transcriptional regulator